MCSLLFLCGNARERGGGGLELLVYKTTSDTINYVSEGCSEADSTATAVVPLPLNSSVVFFIPPTISSSSPSPWLGSVLSTVTLDSVKAVPQSQRRVEAKLLCVRACVCVCLGREKVVLYNTENSHLSRE